MFTAKKQEVYLKGYKTIESGTFKDEDGRDVPFDGYKQIILSVMNKNNEFVDVKCRIPNTSEYEQLYAKFIQTPLMTRLLVDVEIQISKSGTAKYFLTNMEIAK